MDPNRKDKIEDYESNAKIMYYIGFAFVPLSWLMCWIYCEKRKTESEYLRSLSSKAFVLFWIAIFIIGIWTAINDAYWPSLTSIAYNTPIGEPE